LIEKLSVTTPSFSFSSSAALFVMEAVTRMPPPISSSTLNDEIKPQELRLHAAKIVAPYLFLPYVMQE
jgi:hypothetical protein